MILVTGASGFIGRALVRSLTGSGNDVRALVRSPVAARMVRTAADEAAPGRVETVSGDLSDADVLKSAAAGAETVIHLAGRYRGRPDELAATHIDGTANLLASLGPGTRLVYVSSTSVYGWEQQWPADHASPPRPTSAYGHAKLAAERLVTQWTAGPTVIARPTIVYGPGDTAGMIPRCAGLMSHKAMRFPGTGQNRIHLTHVDDVVSALVAMVADGDGIYVVAGPEAAPLRRILTLLAEGAGLKAPSFGIPAGPLTSLAAKVEEAWSALGLSDEPPLNRHAVEVATRDRAYSARRAIEELGWKPTVNLADGIGAFGREWAAQNNRPRSSATQSSATSKLAVVSGNARSASGDLGFDWRSYLEDPDEGLGTVYERFALDDVLANAVTRTGATSVLHAPLFGMMGFPGLDAVTLARTGIRVGLLDYDLDRLEAVTAQWHELGLDPEIHLVEGPDPQTWPEQLKLSYDLVFSFAALWWFDDPWTVLAAQARWASKGVLTCVPNKNVFMRMRASLWHRNLFDDLNEEALDRHRLTAEAQALGLAPVGTGLFDIPPFPDTSVPLAKVVRALLASKKEAAAPEGEESGTGTWAWSILPFLKGEDPTMPDRIARLARWETYLPTPVAPGLAHHRYTLFVNPSAPASSETSGSEAVAAGTAVPEIAGSPTHTA